MDTMDRNMDITDPQTIVADHQCTLDMVHPITVHIAMHVHCQTMDRIAITTTTATTTGTTTMGIIIDSAPITTGTTRATALDIRHHHIPTLITVDRRITIAAVDPIIEGIGTREAVPVEDLVEDV